MLKTNKVYITGWSIIVYKDYVEEFYRLYENKIIDFQNTMITDDDQNLVLQIYYDNPKLFCLKYSKKWFSLFRENFNK
jgi:hypothetical protein